MSRQPFRCIVHIRSAWRASGGEHPLHARDLALPEQGADTDQPKSDTPLLQSAARHNYTLTLQELPGKEMCANSKAVLDAHLIRRAVSLWC